MTAKSLRVDGERPGRRDGDQRGPILGVRENLPRKDGGGQDADDEVDHAGDEDAAEQCSRVVALRLLGLFGDVDGVLEPDQRVEGERGSGERSADEAATVAVEREGVGDVALAVAERGNADHDHAG